MPAGKRQNARLLEQNGRHLQYNLSMNALSTFDLRRHGRFLWSVRLLWLLLLVLTISLLIANAPSNVVYARLEYQVQQAREAIFTYTSLSTFAGWLVIVRWLVVAVYFVVALLIARRKWEDWFALSVSAALLALAWGFVMRGDRDTWLYPALLQPLAPQITFVLGQLPIAALALLFFLFPNGRFVFRWHKWPVLLLITATALFFHADTFRFAWRAYRPFLAQWAWPLWAAFLLGSLLIAMAGQVYRYRHLATPVQRQQMKWVLFGLAGMLAIPLISWPLQDFGGAWGALAAIGLQLAAVVFLPITIAFSMLRYRLWDVDLIINRTLVFGGLTLLVAAVYILTVGLLSAFALFHSSSPLLYVLATGLIAILFHPLRQRLQRLVNRLTYGERDDPVSALSRLGERLENTAIPGETLPAIVETIGQTLKLPYVAIVVSGSGDAETVAEYGRPLAKTPTFPLVYQGREIGRLLAATRGSGEQFTAAERRLLANLARQAGPAVYAEQLTNRLQLSRERLVTAREEERRRLRRDLHDGLGPQLATLAIKASTAQNLLHTKPDAAAQLLAEVKAESQSAVREIRRVVDDLRPSVLDQLGLASAVQEFAAKNGVGGTRFLIQMPDEMPPLPAAVEVAAYRIVTEAITNVLRHARARTCTVRLEVGSRLHLLIEDDGQGLPDAYEPGVGLDSMHERAAELGGILEIQSQPGRGTRLLVELPVGESA